jgi:hypothetical protein
MPRKNQPGDHGWSPQGTERIGKIVMESWLIQAGTQ